MAVDSREVGRFRRTLLRWFRKNARIYPWRQTTDPWKVLIAEMMLQRTKADQVVPVYRNFFRKFKTPADLIKARSVTIYEALESLGLTWRVANFRSLAKELVRRFNGHIPESRDQLLTLPGVGDYVAGAVLSIAFRQREWIVDSNVVRVFKRYFRISTSNEGRRDKLVVELAKQYCRSRNPREANLALLDLAALICVSRKPQCFKCPLRKGCSYPRKTHEQNVVR